MRKAAKRPAARTVTATIEAGEFAGWSATAKADFPARVLSDLQSGNVDRLVAALDAIIIDHNMPDTNDEIAASMGDVEPYEGVMLIGADIFDQLAKLPNR
jgi:hypothetical protein